jgi:hypothetical protein
MNGTWSFGNQRGLGKLPGGNADCGQHAAGGVAGGYTVGSIDPYGGGDQPLAARTPLQFDPAHGLIDGFFRIANIPAHAQAVAYVNFQTGAFHYARITGQGLTQTDAHQAQAPGMGGTFQRFGRGPNGTVSLDNLVAQRGVQPIQAMPDPNAFVNYCGQHYDLQNGLFFFCKFN